MNIHPPPDPQDDPAPYGQSALLLGGAQGAGYDLARHLGRTGMQLALTDPDPEAARIAARSLGQTGLGCDPAQNRDMAKLGYAAGDLLGDIDLVVLSLSGGLPPGGSAAMSEADFTAHLLATSLPLLQVTRHLVPAMKARGTGAVVVLAQVPSRPDPWQDAAAAWLEAATRSLAQEWGASGVTLNTVIAPRAVAAVLPKFMQAPQARLPDADVPAPAEVAQSALAFCRKGAGVSGQVLRLPRPVAGPAIG